jgi:Putative MetA-pathway of phenol degradation
VVRGQGPVEVAGRAGVQVPATSLGQPQPPIPNPAASAPAITDLVPAPANFTPDVSGPGPIIQPMPAVGPDGLSPWGLSSIARNRLANRAPGQARAGALGASADGAGGSGYSEGRTSGMSSILRNRLDRAVGAGQAPEYSYPDIRAQPAQIYRDRYGVFQDEEPDRFLFPWIMNLIFEDRWLLAERDPAVALQNQLRRRLNVDIRDPDPDTANFPNGAYTLPKGRFYVENSPVGFYGPSRLSSAQYNWEYLLRYGMTDNLELRIFSNGLTATKGKNGAVGLSPLAFDFKINFWEENTRYWLPAMGAEFYLQTTLGSPAFNSGTQPSIALLFDQTMPLGFNLEQNFGITGNRGVLGENVYAFSYQWAVQHQIVKDFDMFWQGFYNAAALPRLRNFTNLLPPGEHRENPTAVVTGVGAIWTVNDRLAIFGSYNFGLTKFSPSTIALLGFAVAF